MVVDLQESRKQIDEIDRQIVELFEKTELGVKPKIVYEVDYNFFETYMKK